MTKLRISTPVPDFTGVSAGVNFTNGAAVVDVPDDPTDPTTRAVAYFRSAGYGVEEVADEPATPGADAALDELRERHDALLTFAKPNKAASTETWRAYAVLAGMPAAEAEALSRDELAARYIQEAN